MTIWQLLSIVFFVLMCYGMGAGLKALLRVKNQTPLLEHTLRFLLGLGIFPILAFIIDTLRIPLHWSLFLAFTLAGLAYSIWYDLQKKSLPFNKPKSFADINWGIIAAIALVLILAFVMIKGANMYPYLEDDDPWQHAEGTLFVSKELTYRQPKGDLFTHYLAPYPPFFDALLGVLTQVSHDIPWTLKFFNGLLVGLMLLSAYVFFALLIKSRIIAVVATSVLLVAPAFASHFIWSQTYALDVLFIALATAVLAAEDKEWFILAILMLGSSLIIQPSATFMNGLTFFIMWIAICVWSLLNKKKIINPATKRLFLIGAVGLGIAVIFYGVFIAMYGNDFLVVNGISLDPGAGAQGFGIGDTSGGVVYGFNDFWDAPMSSKIDQATGFGWFISCLAILGFIILIIKFKELRKREWVIVGGMLFILGVIYMQGNRFPHHLLYVHRYWPWLCIPVAMMVGLTVMVLLNSIRNSIGKLVALVIIGALLVTSAGQAKYAVQTATWPPGVHWNSQEELAGYAKMANSLPKNAAVFSICKDDKVVIGMGMYSPVWDPEVRAFHKIVINATGQQLSQFLKEHKYEYVTIDATCVKDHGLNATQALLARMSEVQTFSAIAQENGFVLARFMG